MIRASTPCFAFALPLMSDRVADAEVTFAQSGVNLLRKRKGDCELREKKLSVRLTQEESLLFSEKAELQLQLRVLTTDGRVLPSQIFSVPVIDSLSEEVL